MHKNASREEISKIFSTPLLPLIFKASQVHSNNQNTAVIETCNLLSVKTGNCPEDCAYCAQSAHNKTFVSPHQILDKDIIIERAKAAVKMNATHFCLGSSGRQVKNNKDFETLLEIIKEVSQLNVRICATLGMLNEESAQKLKTAGLYGYNHNLDTGSNYYSKIVTTHTYQDRLDTLKIVASSGLKLCSGGILGLGEAEEDRIDLLYALANLPIEPHSIPINVLISIKGTKLEKRKPITIWELLRFIATARIIFPKTILRFAGGRGHFSQEDQLLCFLAGINGVHVGEKLLTVSDCSLKYDQSLLKQLLYNCQAQNKQIEALQKL